MEHRELECKLFQWYPPYIPSNAQWRSCLTPGSGQEIYCLTDAMQKHFLCEFRSILNVMRLWSVSDIDTADSMRRPEQPRLIRHREMSTIEHRCNQSDISNGFYELGLPSTKWIGDASTSIVRSWMESLCLWKGTGWIRSRTVASLQKHGEILGCSSSQSELRTCHQQDPVSVRTHLIFWWTKQAIVTENSVDTVLILIPEGSMLPRAWIPGSIPLLLRETRFIYRRCFKHYLHYLSWYWKVNCDLHRWVWLLSEYDWWQFTLSSLMEGSQLKKTV
jgi:hypothetical protein